MIASNNCRSATIVMKLSQFLRYYQNTKGVSLPQEEAEEEAVKYGMTIDRSGEVGSNVKSFRSSIVPPSGGHQSQPIL